MKKKKKNIDLIHHWLQIQNLFTLIHFSNNENSTENITQTTEDINEKLKISLKQLKILTKQPRISLKQLKILMKQPKISLKQLKILMKQPKISLKQLKILTLKQPKISLNN